MASLLHTFLFGKKYIGIELFSIENIDTYAILQVQRKKQELLINKQDLTKDLSILKDLKSKVPAIGIINNNHVLQKEVKSIDANDKKLLNKAFPNIQADDFYYEIWRRESTSIISICRKNYVDNFLAELQPFFRISNVSLGTSSIANLMVFQYPDKLFTSTQIVYPTAEENIVVTNNNHTKTVNSINGLEIAGNYLLGFCATLHYLLPNSTTGNIEDFNHTLNEDFKQKTFFEKILLTSIGTILLLLIINFFLFTHYFDKTEELNESLALNRTSIETITKLKERIKEKEQRLKSFTGNTNAKSAFLLNEIVRKLPYSIVLTQIDFYPLEKKIKPDEPVITRDNEIIISGTSINNEDFTKWIEVTGKISRIGKVTILNFGKDQENNTIFSVKIVLKP